MGSNTVLFHNLFFFDTVTNRQALSKVVVGTVLELVFVKWHRIWNRNYFVQKPTHAAMTGLIVD